MRERNNLFINMNSVMKLYYFFTLGILIFLMGSCEKDPKIAEWCCEDPVFEVPEPPVQGSLVASKTATYSGDVIQFLDDSSGDIVERQWTFEGGIPEESDGKEVAVTYENPGRYQVTLITIGKEESDTLTSSVVVIPAQGLAAYFPFNGAIKDNGPLEISFTTPGDGNIYFSEEDRFQVPGDAATFDGNNGILLASNEAFAFETSDYTVSCWVKSSSTSRMMIWQEAGREGGGDPQSWLRMGDNSSDRYLRFHVGSILNFGEEGQVSDGEWHHLVGVREGTVQRMYLNGEKIGEQSTNTLRDVSSPDQVFKIGFQENTSGFINHFQGEMDDFIVYKRAISDEEVKALFEL